MYAVAAVWVMSKKSTLFTKIEQKICTYQKKVVSLQAELKFMHRRSGKAIPKIERI